MGNKSSKDEVKAEYSSGSLKERMVMRRKYLIFGYIRQKIEPKLKNSKLIPVSIMELCQAYYPFYEWIDLSIYNTDYFERTEVEDETGLNQKSIFLKNKVPDTWSGFYSKNGFKQGIIAWKFKCIEYSSSNSLCGICPAIVTTNKRKILLSSWLNNDEIPHSYYLFAKRFWHFKKGEEMEHVELQQREYITWKENDEYMMILDFEQGIFQVAQIREGNQDETVFEINIDHDQTYYPALGFRVDGKAVVQVVLA